MYAWTCFIYGWDFELVQKGAVWPWIMVSLGRDVEYKMFSWWMRGFNFKTVISTWGTFWAIITIAFAINYKVVITCIWESLNITIRHFSFQINLPVRIMAFHVPRRYCWHDASLWRFSLCLARLVTENFLVYVHHI